MPLRGKRQSCQVEFWRLHKNSVPRTLQPSSSIVRELMAIAFRITCCRDALEQCCCWLGIPSFTCALDRVYVLVHRAAPCMHLKLCHTHLIVTWFISASWIISLPCCGDITACTTRLYGIGQPQLLCIYACNTALCYFRYESHYCLAQA